MDFYARNIINRQNERRRFVLVQSWIIMGDLNTRGFSVKQHLHRHCCCI